MGIDPARPRDEVMNNQGIGMRALTMGLMALALAGCDMFGTERGEWDGWVYPDAGDLSLSISLVGLKTFEDCQEAAIGVLRSLPDPERAEYECGRGCRWKPEIENNLCSETKK